MTKHMLIGKLDDKIVEITNIVRDVRFSDEKDWVCVCTEPGKMNSLGLKWYKISDVRFDWVREFNFRNMV